MGTVFLVHDPDAAADRVAQQVMQVITQQGHNVDRMFALPLHSAPFGKALHARLEDSDLIVAILVDGSPNTYFELGLAHGMGKPVLMIVDSGILLPTDLVGMTVFRADFKSGLTAEFKFLLRENLKKAFRDPQFARGFKWPPLEDETHSSAVPVAKLSLDDLLRRPPTERAALFEDWLCEVLSHVDGWEVIRPSAKDPGYNYDFVIWNDLEDSALRILGNPIPVEAKSAQIITPEQISSLLHHVRQNRVHGFLLIGLGTVSAGARKRISELYKHERILGVVLDQSDLRSMQSTDDFLKRVREQTAAAIFERRSDV